LTPGAMPGTHRIHIDKNDVVWLSENWAHNLTSFDPRTRKFTQRQINSDAAINSPGFGNFALAPDGSIWWNQDSEAEKIDPETGKVERDIR
jgi:streptogramin lyase